MLLEHLVFVHLFCCLCAVQLYIRLADISQECAPSKERAITMLDPGPGFALNHHYDNLKRHLSVHN